jgi:hypothetical protein
LQNGDRAVLSIRCHQHVYPCPRRREPCGSRACGHRPRCLRGSRPSRNDRSFPPQAARRSDTTSRVLGLTRPSPGPYRSWSVPLAFPRRRSLLRIRQVYQKLPASVFLRGADAIHLATAAESGFPIVYSNDAHPLAAAQHFGIHRKNIIFVPGVEPGNAEAILHPDRPRRCAEPVDGRR